MDAAPPDGYEHLAPLLFVTTAAAMTELKTSEKELRSVVGDRLLVIPGSPMDIHGVVDDHVRPRLQTDAAIAGVVLLGSYGTVPSRKLLSYDVDPGLGTDLKSGNIGFDHDAWLIWTDDLYGDLDGNGIADLPVSRIPIAIDPERGGLLGFPRSSTSVNRLARGYRSDDCGFAHDVFSHILAANGGLAWRISPPDGAEITGPTAEHIAAHDLDATSLPANWLYLVMHGFHDRGKRFRGMSNSESIDSVNVDLVVGEAWPADGTVFAAVCWGGLSAQPALLYDEFKEPPSPPTPRTADNSIALALLSRGINAFVGFTGHHYVPVTGSILNLTHGVPLHHRFWENVIAGSSPARALHDARRSYIEALVEHPLEPTDIRIHVKTYWSATCLGLGW